MQLSPAQKAAVEYLGGPQIILAGAGSGKTRVIVAKAQYLLESKGYAPDSIQIITYSTKTQAELEERMAILGERMPEVRTFHSFGMDIISEFGHFLKLPTEVAKLSEYKLWQILKRAISEFAKSDLLDTNQPERVYRDLLGFIGRAKDELLRPEEIIARAERELAATGENSGNDEAVLARERWTKVWEAGKIFASYERIKSADAKNEGVGGIDYGDMIVLAHRLLREEKVAAATVRKRCRYVLVDEFQDANFAQVEILRLMSGPDCGVTVVGDDDQAIYRFRGASFASFKLFQKLFPGWKVFRLEENYRSQENIVRAAQALIEIDPQARFDAGKKMAAVEKPGIEVIVRKCPDDYSEALAVAEQIKELLLDEEYKKPSSVAVLVRARRHRDLLTKILERQGIDFSYDRNQSEQMTAPARLLMALYEFTVDDSRIYLLPSIMNHFIPNLRPDIERQFNFKLARETGDPLAILQATKVELSEKAPTEIDNIIDFLKRLRESASQAPPLQLLEQIAAEAGIIKAVIGSGVTIDHEAAKEIAEILRGAEQFQLENSNATHAAFLEYLEWQGSYGKDDDNNKAAETSVVIQTVHGSKGLEYPVVFMIGLSNSKFPPRKRHAILEFPQELFKEELPSGDYRIQEERRLFYVAMTRARRILYLYGVEKKGIKISQFISELERSPVFKQVGAIEVIGQAEPLILDDIGPKAISGDPQAAIIIPSIQPIAQTLARGLFEIWKKQSSIMSTAEDFEQFKANFQSDIALSLEKFKETLNSEIFQPPTEGWRYKVKNISYSDIEAFRSCPLKFYYRKVLSLPTPSGPQQAFGSTIHGVLEEAGKALMENRKPALDELVASFERRWVQAGLSDPDRKERLRIRGRETLERFLNMQAERPGQPVALEKMFAINLLPERGGESPVLTGRIDRIDTTSSGFEIIDYKTGKQTDLKSDLQLAIYSLACRSLLGEYAGRVIYMFLGEGTIHEASYDADALEVVKSEILGVIEEITKSDFMATPGHACNSCPFAKICPARLDA